jgi:hypothetical protein
VCGGARNSGEPTDADQPGRVAEGGPKGAHTAPVGTTVGKEPVCAAGPDAARGCGHGAPQHVATPASTSSGGSVPPAAVAAPLPLPSFTFAVQGGGLRPVRQQRGAAGGGSSGDVEGTGPVATAPQQTGGGGATVAEGRGRSSGAAPALGCVGLATLSKGRKRRLSLPHHSEAAASGGDDGGALEEEAI